MAAPLAVGTKEEQRAVIRFLCSEGVPGAEVNRRLSTQYGDNALPRRRVYEWIEKFKSGRTNVTHEEGARRTIVSSVLKIKNTAFCPYSVFQRVVWFSKQLGLFSCSILTY